MRSHIRSMVAALCLMFGNAFVLRSNGIITRTLLKYELQMEKWQKAGLGQNSKKDNNTEWIWCKKGKTCRQNKSSNKNVLYKCHKNLLKKQISAMQGKGMKLRKKFLLCYRRRKTSNMTLKTQRLNDFTPSYLLLLI